MLTTKTATSGQQQIIQSLQENADLTIDNKQHQNTERWLSQLDAILPDNPFQPRMRNQIAKQINEALLQAEQGDKVAQDNLRILNAK